MFRMAEAIIFIGIPASGKSSFYYERFFRTHMRINLDMLRTRNRESKLLQYCIDTELSFVVDNTNPLKSDRHRYFKELRGRHFKIIGYYFQSKIEESLLRNQNRKELEQIPEGGLRSIYAKLELPDISEGFDELYYVSIDVTGAFLVKEWTDEI